MPMFHATLAGRLASIYKHGLGGGEHAQLWEGAERGVYLATDPVICIWVMIEGFLLFASDEDSPKDHFSAIRVIVIDDSRYDASRLGKDPLLEKRDDVFLYRGVIDVVGMPTLTIEQVRGVPSEPHDLTPEDEASTRKMMRSILDAREEHRQDGRLRRIY